MKSGPESTIRALAFAVPGFAPAPADDPWWSRGFVEWANVARARQRFPGHQQPRVAGDFGYYDPRNVEVKKAQAELARAYGIDGFCYYHRGGATASALEELLRSPEPDFPFCLCWSRDSAAEGDRAIVATTTRFLRDPRYIRVGDRPLLVIHRPDLVPDLAKAIVRWRKGFQKRGVGDIYLVGGVTSPDENMIDVGFDAGMQIPPLGLPVPDRTGEHPPAPAGSCSVYRYDELVARELQYFAPGRLRFFTAMLAWDSTPAKAIGGEVFHRFTPEAYERWLTAAVLKTVELYPADERIVFINAWNDWVNGAYLEPDVEHGFECLEATRRALLETDTVSQEFRDYVLGPAREAMRTGSVGRSRGRVAAPRRAASSTAATLSREEALACIRESPLTLPEWCLHNLGEGVLRDDAAMGSRYFDVPIRARPRLSPYFDPVFYATQNPDVERSGVDPYAHFLVAGFGQNRDPHPLISLGWMAERFAREFPFLEWNLRECERVLRENAFSPHPLFDLEFYLRHDPVLVQNRVPAVRHFLEHGAEDGLDANEYFDYGSYLANSPDAGRSRLACFLHFAQIGDLDRRRPGPRFDPDAYLQQYPDAMEALDEGTGPLAHFLSVGRSKGYLPAPLAASRVGTFELVEAEAVDAQRSGLAFEATAAMLRQVERQRIAQFRERRVSFVEPGAQGKRRAFAASAAPRVSIVIPVYGHLELLQECLASLCDALTPNDAVEVIVIDDKPDESARGACEAFDGIRYLSNEANLGFLKAANRAMREARGEHVLLLNSDVQVPKGFLAALVAVMERDPRVGVVGPKLIYPNGRLQEAGCAFNLDASTVMVGVGSDPELPDYSFDRQVDYCSGACLLVRTKALKDIGGGFDEAFAPSYCEDGDLCLAVRAAGWRVVYCASVAVIHHLSASHDKIGTHVKLERTVRNQARLFSKWSATLEQMNRIRAIAFYLPQFHRIPENDLWWGAGFTEWTNVAKARANFSGHYQPHLPADLGYYDLNNAGVMKEQAALASRYGIDGFCFYYYNFGGRRILDTPLRNLMADPSIPMKFCLAWANENWTKNWDGGERQVLLGQPHTVEAEQAVIEDIVQYLRDPRYIRIEGRPFFLVYRPLLLRDARDFAQRLRAAARDAGVGEIVLGAVEGMDGRFSDAGAAQFGFDIAVEFAPHGAGAPTAVPGELLNKDFTGTVNSYPDALRKLAERQRPYPRMRCVFPNWDNTPRRQHNGLLFYGSSPESFEAHAEHVIRKTREQLCGDWRMFFVNAWNEWAEGAHLEPDRRYGHRWLEAIRNAKLRAGAVL